MNSVIIMKAIKGTVTGRVQGVGFRYFAIDAADESGLAGWVRNLPDGNVEFFAQGNEKELQNFTNKLKIGPPLSRVDKLLINTIEPDMELRGFEAKF